MTYTRLDMTVHTDGSTTAIDLEASGVLLRYANTDSAADARYLVRNVAEIVAVRGIDAGLTWLDGYWYATGVRHHEIVVGIQQLLFACLSIARIREEVSNGL